MLEQAKEVKVNVTSIEGLEEFFDSTGTAGTLIDSEAGTERTLIEDMAGQPGHSSVEATDITTYISTSSAAKLASVDSRTVRRWHDAGRVRGQFSKGKLLIAKEDIERLTNEDPILSGTTGTADATVSGASGTPEGEREGRPGPDADMPAPVIAFSDFLDRIERLSRENGELRALLERERLETQQLRLLTDSQHKANWWQRFCSWFVSSH